MPSLQKFVEAMEWAATSDLVGYSQSDRDGIFGNVCGKRRVNADCSSLVIACLQYAGFETGAAGWTGNMAEELVPLGWRRVKVDGEPQAGDILLNEANHVCACIGGGMVAQASQDERGRYTGGKAGDQTGDEVNIRAYYDFPWDMYLRWTGGDDADAGGSKAAAKPAPDHACAKDVAFRVSCDPYGRKWLAKFEQGKAGKPIYFIALKAKKYRVFTLASGWLPWVRGYDVRDLDAGCAGDGSAILGVQVKDATRRYAVRALGGAWHDDMVGLTDTGGSPERFAGDLAGKVDGFFCERA